MDDKAMKVRELLSSYYGTDGGSGAAPAPAAPERRPRAASSSLDREEFDGEDYVRRLFARGKLKALLSQHNKLVHELRGLDAGLQALVYENYSKFISATDTIRTMGDAMDRRGVHMMSSLRDAATSLKAKMDDTDATLSSSRARIDELSGVRLMLRKLKRAADLPAKLRRLLEADGAGAGPGAAAARLLLASSYVVDASPSLPSLGRLPPPMCTAAAELAHIRRVCEDRLVSVLSSGDCGAGGGDADVDIDEVCEALVKLIRSGQGLEAGGGGAGAVDTDVIVCKLVRAETERARRIVDRAAAAAVPGGLSAQVSELNKAVLPLVARALHRWKLLFSSIMDAGAGADGEASGAVVSRLGHEVFGMYLGAVEGRLRAGVAEVFAPPGASGGEMALLREHCDCLRAVAVDAGRVAGAGDAAGGTLMRQTAALIEREVCRVLGLMRGTEAFDARTMFEAATAGGGGARDVCERAVGGLEAGIDAMVRTLTEYCLLLTREGAGALMLREWEAALEREFSLAAGARIGAVPATIAATAELVKDSGRAGAGRAPAERSPVHESIQRLSKLARSVSSMLADRALPAMGRWAAGPGPGGEGLTPVDRVCARLQEVAGALQREYMVMDSEEEAQKLMDEVARGLEKAQAGAE